MEQADEALADPEALVFDPDYASRSGRSARTIGYSPTAGRLLTVITMSEGGVVYGVNGWPSNDVDRGVTRKGTTMAKRAASEIERLIEQEAEHVERHRDDPIPAGVTGARPNRAKSVMFSLRLNPDEFAEVQRLAGEHGVPASALVRGWILHRIAAEANAPSTAAAAVERLEDDVRALRRLVRS